MDLFEPEGESTLTAALALISHKNDDVANKGSESEEAEFQDSDRETAVAGAAGDNEEEAVERISLFGEVARKNSANVTHDADKEIKKDHEVAPAVNTGASSVSTDDDVSRRVAQSATAVVPIALPAANTGAAQPTMTVVVPLVPTASVTTKARARTRPKPRGPRKKVQKKKSGVSVSKVRQIETADV